MNDIIETVLVVDDDMDIQDGLIMVMEAINSDRAKAKRRELQYASFESVDLACEWVRSCPDPFLSILDHDLGDPVGRTGLFISECIRREHSLGLLLPIMYYSGRFKPAEFIDERISHGDMSPTFFLEKGRSGTRGHIEKALNDFDQKWALALTQSSQQALMTLRMQEERNEFE